MADRSRRRTCSEVVAGHFHLSLRKAMQRLLGYNTEAFGLDGPYLELLSVVAEGHPQAKQRNDIRLLLSFVVLSFDPLESSEIDGLLRIESSTFLPSLSSVIHIPEDGGPLRVIHASFHDFLVDPQRCISEDITYINPIECHKTIAIACFATLESLHWDILGLSENVDCYLPETKNSDLADHISKLPKRLCYAVKHWTSHVSRCVVDGRIDDNELLQLVDVLVKTRLVYWIEALSYLSYLKEGRRGITEMMNQLPVS
jgi:hypothetical protein